MANLSNINGKFVVEQTTGYVGVGTTDPNYPIEVLNASAEIALNASGGSIYRVQSDSASNFIIRKAGVGDRLVINSAGNATFAGNVTAPTLNLTGLTNNASSTSVLVLNQILGSELITNGDFDTSLDWTVTNAWSIANGKATYGGSGTSVIFQAVTLANATQYRILFTVSGSSGNGARIWIGNSQGNTNYEGGSYEYYANGTHERVFTMPSAQTNIGIYSTTGGSGYDLDLVSLKQVLGTGTNVEKREFSSNAFAEELWEQNANGINNIGGVNVGIGTDNPLTTLHVNKSSDAQVLVQGTNKMALHQDAAWNSNILLGCYYDGSNIVYGTTNRGAFKIVGLHDSTTQPQTLSIYGANGASAAGSTVTFNSVGFSQDEDGNVGIGTTSPGYKLDVDGMVAIRNSTGPQLLFFETGSAYTDGMRLLRYQDKLSLTYGWNANEEALTVVGGTGSDVGNVGIGTTSPDTKLMVSGEIVSENTSGGYFISTRVASGSARPSLNFYGTHLDINYVTGYAGGGASTKVSISNLGAVSIGTSNNAAKLNVGGPILASDNNLSAGMYVRRSLNLSHPGNTGTFTRTFNPVTQFGMAKAGGYVLLEVAGWSQRVNCGYIQFQNAGGSGNITSVVYVQTAVNGNGSISVSVNSAGDNSIDVNFSNWHGNSHGWQAKIITQ